MIIVKDAKTGNYLCYKSVKDIPDDKAIFFMSNSEQLDYISGLIMEDNSTKGKIEEEFKKDGRRKS